MKFFRSKNNPILFPITTSGWESKAVFNGSPVEQNGKIYLLYRALSHSQYNFLAEKSFERSTIGIAESDDGINFSNRKLLIKPKFEWEKFGCEDPRVTYFEGKYYIFYTALSDYPHTANGIKIGVAITKDIEKIEERHIVTPFNSKAMTLFPERINNKIAAILTVDTDRPPIPSRVCIVFFDKESDMFNENFWLDWYKNIDKHTLSIPKKESEQIEVGGQPILIDEGWVIFYSRIQNYFSNNKLFGIEALLLEKDNPFNIVGQTSSPLATPQEYYEIHGMLPNIIFPSGSILRKDVFFVYYGAADTTCCLATIEKKHLLNKIKYDDKQLFTRAKTNPILKPKKENPWEAFSTFNPAAIYLDGEIHIVYRAMSHDNTSVMGYAKSKDGINIYFRSDIPIYSPSGEFEKKGIPNGNSGAEDPRLIEMDGIIYMLYTAYNGLESPRIALTSISKNDFLAQKWDNWKDAKYISPRGYDDKDASFFPKKFNNQYLFIHRIGNNIDIAYVNNIEFPSDETLSEDGWIYPRKGWWDSKKIGLAAPPIETKDGWLMFYHGISENNIYRVGVLLLDLENPRKVLARSSTPIFSPETEYEKKGVVNNVVFPCGVVLVGDTIFMYYGAADLVTGVATAKLEDILNKLKNS